MSILNRRNAVVGWSVLKIGKRVVRRKAPTKSGPPTKPLVAAGLAGAVGALAFWRKRSSSSGES